MLIEVPENVAKKTVVKRDGKKVEFDGAKIALAIRKGFGDIIANENPATAKYNETDVNLVYSKVLSRIKKIENERIKIEEIQDLIEEELKNNNYQDVYDAFSTYREKRTQSRQLFLDEKKQHKFLKDIENLALKSEPEDVSIKSDTAMGKMLQYGSTISRQFAITYLMKKKFVEAHENGDIHIHNIEFLTMGTTTCCQIDIEKLYEDGFSIGETYIREPNDITSYTALAALAIQANQNDQHGAQSIPAFDYYMAPGILKTFKKQFKQLVFDYLELTDFDKFIAINGIEREIEKISTIEFDSSIFDKYCRESEELKRMFRISYQKAIEKTNQITYQAMEAFIHNLNTIYSKSGAQTPFSTINFGTDTSPEGRMIIKNFLEAMQAGVEKPQTTIFPISIFKVKEGVNYNSKDQNYDLLQLACKVASKKELPHFSFLDASFNTKFYNSTNYHTEVAYMGQNARVVENIIDSNKTIIPGRGVLCSTTINLPRLGIKHGNISNEKTNVDNFFVELEEKLDLVKDQLLERFEVQCKKQVSNFPFLLGQGIWLDSEKLKKVDNLKRVLKHGTLTIGFIGLAECLKALTGKHHGESKQAQELGIKIVEVMRKKCNEYSQKYNLNFTLIATQEEEIATRLAKLDKAIYGSLKSITDKEHYTNAFHIPVDYKISIQEKIQIEAPYHTYTNGGHITCIEVKEGTQEIMPTLEIMKKNNIGYGSIKIKHKMTKGDEK